MCVYHASQTVQRSFSFLLFLLSALQQPVMEDSVASSRMDNMDNMDDDDDDDDSCGGKSRARDTVLIPSDAVRRRRILTTIDYLLHV